MRCNCIFRNFEFGVKVKKVGRRGVERINATKGNFGFSAVTDRVRYPYFRKKIKAIPLLMWDCLQYLQV